MRDPINVYTATDREILDYIENIEAGDSISSMNLHWLFVRALKILFRVAMHPVDLEDL